VRRRPVWQAAHGRVRLTDGTGIPPSRPARCTCISLLLPILALRSFIILSTRPQRNLTRD